MKRIGASLLALWMPLLLAAAPMPTARPSDSPTRETHAPPPTAFPGGVRMHTRTYAVIAGFRPLTLDLYLPPPGKAHPRPGLIFVHGGGWKGGDARHAGAFDDFPGVLATLAARGFVVASVNYRLSGEARFPAPVQDVKRAIGWLRGQAADLNLDTTRLAIWGAGAGGQIAALVGVSCGVSALEPPAAGKDKPQSDCVQAVIDWYGVSDFETLAADRGKPPPDTSDAGAYLGCEPALCAIGIARGASPLSYIEPMTPSFLIQHGALDTDVPPKQAQRLYDALTAAGARAELVLYPGAGHDFAPAPSDDGGARDDDVNKQAIEKMEAFLDTLFPQKPMTSPYRPVKGKALPY